MIGQAWRDRWEYVIPFLAYEPEVRRAIYMTNSTEALNRQLRKAIKTKGGFPSEDAARKLIYLAIYNAIPQWTRTRGWTKSLARVQNPIGRPTAQLTINPRLHRKADALKSLPGFAVEETPHASPGLGSCKHPGKPQRRRSCLAILRRTGDQTPMTGRRHRGAHDREHGAAAPVVRSSRRRAGHPTLPALNPSERIGVKRDESR